MRYKIKKYSFKRTIKPAHPFYKNQNKMKGYNVIIETGEMIVSDFIIEAENLKEANKIAQSHKRLERLKGRTRVKRIK